MAHYGSRRVSRGRRRKYRVPGGIEGVGRQLLHKTEVGGVVVNLKSEQEVRGEARRLLGIPAVKACWCKRW